MKQDVTRLELNMKTTLSVTNFYRQWRLLIHTHCHQRLALGLVVVVEVKEEEVVVVVAAMNSQFKQISYWYNYLLVFT